jgi:MFS family permease
MATRSISAVGKLTAAYVISTLGTQISATAIPLAAVLVLDADTWDLGLLSAAQNVPILFLSVPFGIWLARLPLRGMALVLDLLRGGLLAYLAGSFLFGAGNLVTMTVIILLVGICDVAADLVFSALVPAIVPKEELIAVNSNFGVGTASSRAVGRFTGGALIQWFGVHSAFLLDALSYFVSAMFVFRLPAPPPEPVEPAAKEETFFRQALFGASRLMRDPYMGPLTLCCTFSALLGGVFSVARVPFVTQSLAPAPGMVGIYGSVMAAGMLICSMITRVLSAQAGFGMATILGLLPQGPLWVLACVWVGPGSTVLLTLAFFAQGFALSALTISEVTTRQTRYKSNELTRVTSFQNVLIFSAQPLGALACGALGKWLPAETIILYAAIGLFVLPLILLASPLRKSRTVPTAESLVSL